MAARIAVIGGGWYGCHIAATLAARGHQVALHERHPRLLHEASGNNQFRLHLGYHYPRHAPTRLQSRDGFARFLVAYPDLSEAVVGNFYALARGESRLDSTTYALIMAGSGLELPPADPPEGLRGVDAVWRTAERVLLLERARAHFSAQLGGIARLASPVERLRAADDHVLVNGARYDVAIDASWGHLRRPPMACRFEPTLLLYYEGDPDHPAITLVDGPLCSIYPTERAGVFTLSSVAHTPLGQARSGAGARAIRDRADAATIAAHRARMERQMRQYLPDFSDRFRYLGPQLSIKTKPLGPDDDRAARVFAQGRVLSVMSGKIDTIFHAADRVVEELAALGLEQYPPFSRLPHLA